MDTTITNELEIKKPSLPRVYVEDTFKISFGDLTDVLKPIYLHSYPDPIYDGGELALTKFGVTLKLDYHYSEEDDAVVLQFWMPKFARLQEIGLDSVATKFGIRKYFLCDDCGKRCNCLYLRLDNKYWLCRGCQNLDYEIKKYNKRSALGFLGYSLNRHFAVKEKADNIKRVDYGGKLTRKATSLTRMIKRWSPRARLENTESADESLNMLVQSAKVAQKVQPPPV